jgi:hypothetical protein
MQKNLILSSKSKERNKEREKVRGRSANHVDSSVRLFHPRIVSRALAMLIRLGVEGEFSLTLAGL